MKIGIITRHNALNPGAILQAYALQTYIERLGHQVEFIDYRIRREKNIRDFIGKSLLKTINKWEILFYEFKYRNFALYNQSLLKIGRKKYSSLDQLQFSPPKSDVYIAGSDQIWNVGPNYKKFEPYFLNFGAPNSIRISFAASLGEVNIPKEVENKIKKQLLSFQKIGVREKSGVEYLKQLLYGKKEIFHTYDPTFLLSSNEYLKLIKQDIDQVTYKNCIVTYILSQYSIQQLEILNYIKNKLSSTILNLRNPNTGIKLKGAKNIIVNPLQWIKYIYSSNFVICSSFHAVAFSIIFHKPFIAIIPKTNSRITSLLEDLNLTDHIFKELEKNKIDKILVKELDWSKIDKIINEKNLINHMFLNSILK